MTAPGAPTRRRPPLPVGRVVLAVTVALVVAAPAVASAGGAAGTAVELPVREGERDARALLETAVAALAYPHVGRVSVVTFAATGPLVADLEVRVGAVGEVELRRPTQWLLDAPGGGWLRTPDAVVAVTPAATGLRLDVDAVLSRWDASVGSPRELDTGPATPVRLVRRSGAAVEEVVWVDHATGLPVRRETRAPDGDVLRVVAYTDVHRVDLGGPGEVVRPLARPVAQATLVALAEDGYEVPRRLGTGFELLAVGHRDGMATARYGDGLSVLSVYQQHGRLDPAAMEGAVVRSVAGRDVWTWPGSEPLRLVWTGDERTWTVVSDAPLEVIEEALAVLPGDHVAHDVPSRVRRGLDRAWTWVRDLLG